MPTRRIRLSFVECAYSDLRDIFFHNFRGLNGFRYRKGWHPTSKQQLWHILGFHFYQTITTWLEALLVNMSKLVLMFHGKFHCIKAINVRKKNIVQMRPLTAEIKNNN